MAILRFTYPFGPVVDRTTAIAGIGHWQTNTPVIADPLGAGGAILG